MSLLSLHVVARFRESFLVLIISTYCYATVLRNASSEQFNNGKNNESPTDDYTDLRTDAYTVLPTDAYTDLPCEQIEGCMFGHYVTIALATMVSVVIGVCCCCCICCYCCCPGAKGIVCSRKVRDTVPTLRHSTTQQELFTPSNLNASLHQPPPPYPETMATNFQVNNKDAYPAYENPPAYDELDFSCEGNRNPIQ